MQILLSIVQYMYQYLGLKVHFFIFEKVFSAEKSWNYWLKIIDLISLLEIWDDKFSLVTSEPSVELNILNAFYETKAFAIFVFYIF